MYVRLFIPRLLQNYSANVSLDWILAPTFSAEGPLRNSIYFQRQWKPVTEWNYPWPFLFWALIYGNSCGVGEINKILVAQVPNGLSHTHNKEKKRKEKKRKKKKRIN
jgi:hypothetical protein